MDRQTQKQLILSLIRDDLVNLRLVHSLNALGLHDDYMLHLGKPHAALDGRAAEIYAKLKNRD